MELIQILLENEKTFININEDLYIKLKYLDNKKY